MRETLNWRLAFPAWGKHELDPQGLLHLLCRADLDHLHHLSLALLVRLPAVPCSKQLADCTLTTRRLERRRVALVASC